MSEQRKKDRTVQSHREVNSPIGGDFSTQPNSTKIGTWVGFAEVVNLTKFNDQSKEYKIAECRINYAMFRRNGFLSPIARVPIKLSA